MKPRGSHKDNETLKNSTDFLTGSRVSSNHLDYLNTTIHSENDEVLPGDISYLGVINPLTLKLNQGAGIEAILLPENIGKCFTVGSHYIVMSDE